MTITELCMEFYKALLRRKESGMTILPTEKKLMDEYEKLFKEL